MLANVSTALLLQRVANSSKNNTRQVSATVFMQLPVVILLGSHIVLCCQSPQVLKYTAGHINFQVSNSQASGYKTIKAATYNTTLG